MTGVFGFLAGFVSVGVSVGMFAVILLTSIPADLDVVTERAAIYTLALAHLPLMVIEGVFTALVTVFLWRVRPQLLELMNTRTSGLRYITGTRGISS